MSYCINCGTPLPPAAKFCNECGTKQEIIEKTVKNPATPTPTTEPEKETVSATPSYTPTFSSDDESDDYGYYKEDSKDLSSAYVEEPSKSISAVKREDHNEVSFTPSVDNHKFKETSMPVIEEPMHASAPSKDIDGQTLTSKVETPISQSLSGPMYEDADEDVDDEEEFYLPPITLIKDTDEDDFKYEEDVEEDADNLDNVIERPLVTTVNHAPSFKEDVKENLEDNNLSLSGLSSYEHGSSATQQEGRGFAGSKINTVNSIEDPYWDDVLPEIDNEIYQIDRSLVFKGAASVAALLVVIVYLIYML